MKNITAIDFSGKPSTYYLAEDHSIHQWSAGNKLAIPPMIKGYDYNILGLYVYGEYTVLIVTDKPVFIVKHGQECWRSKYMQNQSFGVNWGGPTTLKIISFFRAAFI